MTASLSGQPHGADLVVAVALAGGPPIRGLTPGPPTG
jgi:hypothetical protein